MKCIAALSLLLACEFAATSVQGSSRLQAQVLDDATGQPIAARIAITNPDGKFIEIEGTHSHVDYLDKHWCYVDGAFALKLPASGVQIEIRRGLETLPEIVTLTNAGATSSIEKTFRLHRWIDMRWKSRPHWDLGRAMRAGRSQNALIVWAHVCSLPGEQLPIGVALGFIDGIELLTWNDPVQLPNHWEPWLNSGKSQAEFPVMRAVDLYYQFLNAGYRLPVAAGTDKFYEEIPLGSNRTYAQAPSTANFDGWLTGVRAGKSFVSNGPILEFEADGLAPGNTANFVSPVQVHTRASARSILPFNTLEILCNGEVIGHKTVAIPNNPATNGIYSMQVEATTTLDRSSWLVARVADHPDLKNRILPRGVSVFAHTSPIYYWRDGQKVREEASINYLCKYVEGVLHWLETNPPFYNVEDSRTARHDAEEALRVLKAL